MSKKHKTKECHKCGYSIIQSSSVWSGRPDKHDENMLLTNCPFCNNIFSDGMIEWEPGCGTKLNNEIYEKYINGNPENEKLYNERINGKPVRTPKEIREREAAKLARQKRVQENKRIANSNVPKCPICGSTDLKKLSSLDRSASALVWGFGSNKIGKTYQCNNCKSTF